MQISTRKSESASATHQTIFGLNLLRAVSILIVLLAHTANILSNSRLITLIGSYAADIGVEFFFVLSGFLIGTIIIKTHEAEPVATFKSIKNFWVRRWFRTLPNYFLMMGASVLVLAIGHHYNQLQQVKFPLYFVFLQNATTSYQSDFYSISWSLTIEEWFYFLFPLILFGVQYFIKSKPLSLLFTIFLFIYLPLVGRVLLAHTTQLDWDAGFRKLMPLRLDGIGIGVLAAFFNYYLNSFWTNHKYKLLSAGLLMFSYLMVGFYFGSINIFELLGHVPLVWPMFSMKTFFFTFTDLAVAMFLPFLTSIKQTPKHTFFKGITLISSISYSLYLVHPIVNGLILHFFKGYNNVFMFTAMWVCSIAGAYVLYHVFEKGMTALRDRFSQKEFVPVVQQS